MKLIKLDAIDSTNEFLKGLSNKQVVENFTVITTDNQTNGKGQMGAVWDSEIGKNLIMSVLIKDYLLDIGQIYTLNIIVSIAVIKALKKRNIPDLSIKWPNDIMSYNKKIGGILIENCIKSDGAIFSIAGLGLNVNQTNFENLPKASSMSVVANAYFDIEELLFEIMEHIEMNVLMGIHKTEPFWKEYVNLLFRKGIPMPFSGNNNRNFMGIIQGISSIGKLQVLLEDDTIFEYDIKEIQMLY